ncbi:MAG: DUF2256 and DUF3253 domain-containing protein [Thiohalobacterales bacterium]|nr:DUF2256 and DUF3253 domain-containing protein [Thiohalobacterales bacterium]
MSKASKICRVCGRSFDWRRKFAHNWDEVRYCSSACRQRGLTRYDRRLEQQLLAMVEQRAGRKTLCPSELARKLRPEGEDWRRLMEPRRMAARRLSHQGAVEILQAGHVIDPDAVRGPIRLRRTSS